MYFVILENDFYIMKDNGRNWNIFFYITCNKNIYKAREKEEVTPKEEILNLELKSHAYMNVIG